MTSDFGQRATLAASAFARVTLEDAGVSQTVDLYSEEGLALVSSLWLKLSAEHKIMYEPTWLGRPIIQLPHDIVQMQELVWAVKPDFIVETGVAHGGSLILSASILEQLGGGTVLGIDVEIRPHNRAAIEEHSLAHRIQLIEGSSTDGRVIRQVADLCAKYDRVLIVLDSNHSADHVYAEIQAYAPLVTEGSYLVVMDGAQGQVFDIPRGNPDWRHNNPLTAIERFLSENQEFEVDPHYTRLHVTSNPMGFLRRVAPLGGVKS